MKGRTTHYSVSIKPVPAYIQSIFCIASIFSSLLNTHKTQLHLIFLVILFKDKYLLTPSYISLLIHAIHPFLPYLGYVLGQLNVVWYFLLLLRLEREWINFFPTFQYQQSSNFYQSLSDILSQPYYHAFADMYKCSVITIGLINFNKIDFFFFFFLNCL